MAKQELTKEQKRLDVDLNIIAIVTVLFFGVYAVFSKSLIGFLKNSEIAVFWRLAPAVLLQFGIAGLGVVIVLLWRKEDWKSYGLQKKNSLQTIVGTLLAFLPLVLVLVLSGKAQAYIPFSSVLLRDAVLQSAFPLNAIGILLIVLVWGFFEGYNYVVIADKINQRYPSNNAWMNYGDISCALICLFFHPIDFDFWGILEAFTTFLAIYGMLLVKGRTGNAWGAVFAFVCIWNAF